MQAIIPLGKLIVIAAGTPIPLSTNCGPLAGGVGGTQTSPPSPGYALRQIQLSAGSTNTGAVYVLPRGNTALANPNFIIAAIFPGQTISLPNGVMLGAGVLPENFVVDADTSGASVYGCGFIG